MAGIWLTRSMSSLAPGVSVSLGRHAILAFTVNDVLFEKRIHDVVKGTKIKHASAVLHCLPVLSLADEFSNGSLGQPSK